MPIFRWTTDDLPIRWQSKRDLRAQILVLKKHYAAQSELMRAQNDRIIGYGEYIAVLEDAAESDLQAFEDIVKAEMDVATKLADLQRLVGVLLNECERADAVRAPSGRTGRVGTKAIRTLLA